MDILREFLESSSLHGISYISTAKVRSQETFDFFDFFFQTKPAKILWLLVVWLLVGGGSCISIVVMVVRFIIFRLRRLNYVFTTSLQPLN